MLEVGRCVFCRKCSDLFLFTVYRLGLIEVDVGDDLGADMGIEALDESGAAHGEFLAHDG